MLFVNIEVFAFEFQTRCCLNITSEDHPCVVLSNWAKVCRGISRLRVFYIYFLSPVVSEIAMFKNCISKHIFLPHDLLMPLNGTV